MIQIPWASILVALLLAGCATPNDTNASEDDKQAESGTGAAEAGGREGEGSAEGGMAGSDCSGPKRDCDNSSGCCGLNLMVSVAAVTKEETVDVRVTVAEVATITIAVGGDELVSEDGDALVFTIPLGYGDNSITVTADTGKATEQQMATVTRLATVTLEVVYNGLGEDSVDELWLDINAFPSAPSYANVSAMHPGYPTVHDLLVVWENTTENVVEFSYSESFEQYSVERINGQGNPVSTSAPPWWCYTRNGEAAEGITIEAVTPGDHVLWDLGTCGFV